MDEEWSRREGILGRQNVSVPNSRGIKQFISKCAKYRNDIDRNARDFTQANRLRAEESVSVADYLFEPVCYLPFGHADSLSIVLLDDIDPIHYLTSDIRTTVEEVCLALCPKVESFYAGGTDGVLCDLHTLLSIKTKPRRHKGGTVALSLEHPFQRATPLLIFSKLKVDGLIAVGPSLLFQQVLFIWVL